MQPKLLPPSDWIMEAQKNDPCLLEKLLQVQYSLFKKANE